LNAVKENATLPGGALKTDDTRNVAALLLNVERLRSHGVAFTHREIEHDIIVRCPLCQRRLIVHESERWIFCMGPITCPANRASFEAIFVRLK
jgi:hypothetical protein